MSVDKWYDLASIVISAVALAFALISWRKSHATERQMLDIERQMLAIEQGRDSGAAKEAARAKLMAKMVKPGRGRQAVRVTNEGQGEARNIRVLLDGLACWDHEAVEGTAWDWLSAGAKFSIELETDLDADVPKVVLIEWEDGSGEPGRFASEL